MEWQSRCPVNPAARNDRGINTDDFAAQIDQRTAAVPGIDRRICLQKVAEPIDPIGPSLRADNAIGHRLVEAERIADREDKIARLHRVGVAELERFHTGLIDFQNREIELLSAPIRRAFCVRPSLKTTSISST